MRELRVIGIEPDGSAIICADINTGAKFKIAADDRLRAASHGDVTRLGQIDIEMNSRLRPREMQTRVRAGASVAEIAEMAGIPASRVERFVYPVLLERTRMSELAQQAHPAREEGPANLTLSTAVAMSFGARGQSYENAQWDAWRGEDGKWVAQLSWQTGCTDNKAHWRFQPGADGGSATPLDDAARELAGSETSRPLRTISTIATTAPIEATKPTAKPAPAVAEPVAAPAPAAAASAAPVPAAAEAKASPARDNKRAKPAIPSWDDVLLGVRTGGQR